MDNKEVLSQLQVVFREELDNDSIILTGETTANDVEEWDSLTHIMLVVATEKNFNIRFASKEIQSWKNINELVSCIEGKI